MNSSLYTNEQFIINISTNPFSNIFKILCYRLFRLNNFMVISKDTGVNNIQKTTFIINEQKLIVKNNKLLRKWKNKYNG